MAKRAKAYCVFSQYKRSDGTWSPVGSYSSRVSGPFSTKEEAQQDAKRRTAARKAYNKKIKYRETGFRFVVRSC